MRDEAHVGLVDPHAERDGRDHHHILRRDESARIGLAERGIETGVISARRAARRSQRLGQSFGFGAALGIDDAWAGIFGEEIGELPGKPITRRDRVADIRPVETRQDQPLVGDAELGEDVGAGMLVRGRGQGEARHIRMRIEQAAQLTIIGPEIVAPFGDAMRFVDRDQGELGAVEQTPEAIGIGALRRRIEQIELAIAQAPHRLVPIRIGGGERGGADACCLRAAHLIVHQRDQRGNDQPRSRSAQAGDLVGERLAGAGRHYRQRVRARHHAIDHIGLAAAEFVETERIVERVEGSHSAALMGPGFQKSTPLRSLAPMRILDAHSLPRPRTWIERQGSFRSFAT